MVQIIRMPMMGNTMEIGILVEWAVSERDEIESGDIVVVVESEKAVQDIEADQDGVLARVDVDEGDEVPPGAVLGLVAREDESLDDAPAPRSHVNPEGGESQESAPDDGETGGGEGGTEATSKPKSAITRRSAEEDAGGAAVRAAPGARKLAAESGVDLASIEGTGPEGAVLRADVEEHAPDTASPDDPDTPSSRAFAPPTTRRLAREHGLSLADIPGTGVGGRVTESDVCAALVGEEAGQVPDVTGGKPVEETPAPGSMGSVEFVEERELRGIRGRIADRMAASARTAPHVTLDREVDVTRSVETAAEVKELTDAEVGFTDVLIAATARALEQHPAFNAWFEDGTHRLVSDVNVAVAVDADRGLITPVIQGVDRRTIADIAAERQRLTSAVLDGSHTVDDLRGGTFTITNLGMLGVDNFNPIINSPQVAILGVGRIVDGSCTLSLSFDHRPVDGADAARFLATIAEGLEAPSGLVARTGAGMDDWIPSDVTGDRGSVEQAATPAEAQRRGDSSGHEAIAEAVSGDLLDRAREIADYHGWVVPEFDVSLDGNRPTITIDRPEDASPPTIRRLIYAACRESQYTDVISGLSDPDVELREAA